MPTGNLNTPRFMAGSTAGWCTNCQRNHHTACSGFRRANHGLRPRCWCSKCREKNEQRITLTSNPE